jgi:hypothetical protein
MKLTFRNILGIALLIALVIIVGSCNRGIGCPSEFSIHPLIISALDPGLFIH